MQLWQTIGHRQPRPGVVQFAQPQRSRPAGGGGGASCVSIQRRTIVRAGQRMWSRLLADHVGRCGGCRTGEQQNQGGDGGGSGAATSQRAWAEAEPVSLHLAPHWLSGGVVVL